MERKLIFLRTICEIWNKIIKGPRKEQRRQSPKRSRQLQSHKQEVIYGPDEEELVDYEPEEPATFSLMEDDISVVGDELSAPTDGQDNIPSTTNDFPANLAEGDHIAGAKRSQMCFGEGEPGRKTSRSIGVGSPRHMILIQQK